MKIVQLIPELNEGGVERGVVDLNREFIKRNIKNIVLSNGGRLAKKIVQDGGQHIKIDIASKNPFTAPMRIFQLRKLLKKIQPDVLHVRSRVPAWLSYFANKGLNIKVVSTVHGFNSINAYSAIMTKADSIICGSKFMVEHIIKYYNAPKEKISLIPRGVDEDYFNNENFDQAYINGLIDKYSLKNKKILIQVARITHWKDQETVIEAFYLLRQKHEDVKLLLVGGYHTERESYYTKLTKLIKELSLEKDVIFVGHTSKIKEIFSVTDINISASNKPETFGRANVEGMFLGVPLIGTNIGATSEYIIENKTGYFFGPKNVQELSNKIEQLLDKKLDKKFIIDFSRKNFTLKSMVEKNIEVYRKVLSK